MSTDAASRASAVDAGETDVVLRISDVAVHYGGIKAVDGISFDITRGKIFGILGPNGSGKSTLLAAITRLTPLTRGGLTFEGSSFATVPPQKVAKLGIARTFQTVRLLPDLTVRENIALGADLGAETGGLRSLLLDRKGLLKRSGDAVEDALERTGLTGMEDIRPGELSYGLQRRVEIARAISMSPRLLLLDEPTAGMNKTERQEVSSLLKKLREEGLTQLLVEHDVQMMVETCDTLIAMNFGVLIAQGRPQAVVREPSVQEAYLGKRGAQDARSQ
ncbi:ABC transporter ATP-binding protein [Rhodococcus sp. BP-252]|uniref:ABC transporter ATP-binding protein n=1 Tax=unclassified Rhodococcus (in: high G+C Gram-positive bacteria) TaxID=192944 RepID=UPI00143090FB|nr:MULTISPECIES: ABC transporter ATP-binding protein [unclassified Rhodococcus (in: high G+C Gram-positive bacteria)]MBY6412643.1 ABC transporter ATP-binding protein [Rhodococcus sp. BP-320]MBY6417102.1 ABC transporter ATP-binding protein [Rhodococcus sp. BP-321]MBY6423190.1 ABC transporter ATP-binding protein [Rhodococcus sp. BP-324]MBY6427126.1 ABC transporter ATP-binding protein [Rhodococcus sp. BP-323]MBY6432261.1 ABC transporter ATP-binding protein [Rhodococcus sp. BP-322]